MYRYRISGRAFAFSDIPGDLLLFEDGDELIDTGFIHLSSSDILTIQSLPNTVHGTINGWVGGENRQVETWSAPSGVLLRVEGDSDFHISPGGQSIIKVGVSQGSNDVGTGNEPVSSLASLDREIMLGPALVLALAMQKTWCLHGSAAVFGTQAFVFLGESGQGKSTLASYLSSNASSDWQLMADDILPVTMEQSGLTGWPHFPQLKLPLDAQPGPNWPEQMPIGKICVLVSANKDDEPDLQPLSGMDTMRVFLSHTAGTRLFDDTLLEKHLAFCAKAVEYVSIHQLTYPHSRTALPKVRELLENLC